MDGLGSRRLTIVTGHYGVGKTELAVNLALALAAEGTAPVMLADLDIVNPYFRSRERKPLLEEAGIRRGFVQRLRRRTTSSCTC